MIFKWLYHWILLIYKKVSSEKTVEDIEIYGMAGVLFPISLNILSIKMKLFPEYNIPKFILIIGFGILGVGIWFLFSFFYDADQLMREKLGLFQKSMVVIYCIFTIVIMFFSWMI